MDKPLAYPQTYPQELIDFPQTRSKQHKASDEQTGRKIIKIIQKEIHNVHNNLTI